MSEAHAAESGSGHALGASRQGTRVVFFTDTQRIIADVDTRQRRLVEFLRDPTRAFVDVSHMSLSRAAEPTQLLASSPRGVLRKSDILLAAIVTEEQREGRRLYAYVAKSSMRVLALLPSCSIVGDIHLPEGTMDGIMAYLKLTDTFMHFTDAEIRFTRTTLPPSHASTVIVNRASVEMLCLAS
jgi:hypothetical protein